VRFSTLLFVVLVLARPIAAAETSVPVPGGTFTMGTALEAIPDLWKSYGISRPGVFENEAPAHQVTVSEFRMDRHEVTYERFERFLAANAGWRPDQLAPELHNGDYLRDWERGRPPAGKGRHPVVFVTWHSAQAFCRSEGGRLPTEAEWEWAARAGDEREFPWGNELPTVERANYHANDLDQTTPVGSYPPNELGLYDLAGNVWEFLLDSWLPYSATESTDPIAGGVVPDTQLLGVHGRRAVRGASYGGAVVNLRTRWRDSHVVTNAIGFVGFRCAYPPSTE
jgi:formylglycine-generating enzyme required for sulfatase activity